MKRLLITAAALALVGAPAAFAQQSQDPQDQHEHNGHQGNGGQGGHQGGGQGGQAGHAPASNNAPSNTAPVSSAPRTAGAPNNGARQWNGVPAGQVGEFRDRPSQPQGQVQAQGRGAPTGGRPDWDAYLRSNPDLQRAYRQNQQSPTYHESPEAFAQRHYQEHGQAEGRSLPTTQGRTAQGRSGNGGGRFGSFQRNVMAQHHYRGPEFRWPRGFSYHRYGYGEFLPQVFFGQNFWLYDYANYDLPYPPPGTAWVRYGPDALLIDRYTGEIVQVIYSVFY